MSIPDGVRELCDSYFKGCKKFLRVNFGSSSSLEWIGALCFAGSGLLDFEIPSTAGAIGGGAFDECRLSGSVLPRWLPLYGVVQGTVSQLPRGGNQFANKIELETRSSFTFVF